jgi:hypothetical protein
VALVGLKRAGLGLPLAMPPTAKAAAKATAPAAAVVGRAVAGQVVAFQLEALCSRLGVRRDKVCGGGCSRRSHLVPALGDHASLSSPRPPKKKNMSSMHTLAPSL